MKVTGYYIFYTFIWIVTLLPLRVLYIFSDILFLILYRIPGYRKKTVATNLKNSLPEKTPEELHVIEKKFYHHLCDLFIETFKLTHMSDRTLMKHFRVTNTELLDRLHSEGRDIIAALGHYGNWEWLAILPLMTKFKVVSVYKPLQNKHFDRFMINIRSKKGMMLSPMKYVIREVLKNRKNNIRTLYAFITDQIPSRGDINFWTNFLNQETPVYLGAEKVSSKYDMAMVFFIIRKINRGYYDLNIELLFEHTAGLPEHFITETHVKKLEEVIRANPEFWIWSHRRWKHKREQQDG
ncbi:MAG: lysophospholipid acyltransferase family protein [Bacteroidales bacterium]|jgi:KDO2-lipid IV(A) lauroyltransferase|nr:lysophospholipid acyltransferase family protein [Bacteroidales bacterium]